LFHFAIGQTTAALDQTIRQRRFAVVDVSDDGKVADLLHRDCDQPRGSGNETCAGTSEVPARREGPTERGCAGGAPPRLSTGGGFYRAALCLPLRYLSLGRMIRNVL